jgi:hypothetical protein
MECGFVIWCQFLVYNSKSCDEPRGKTRQQQRGDSWTSRSFCVSFNWNKNQNYMQAWTIQKYNNEYVQWINTRRLKIAVFWVVAQCSLVKVYQRFRGPYCLHHQGVAVNFYQTTRCYNPEDSNLHTHRRENLKSYKEIVFLHIHKSI